MTQRPIDNPIAVALWCELAGNIVIRNNTFNEAGLSCVALWSNDFISLTIENNTFTANLSGSVTSRAIYLEVGMVGINATIRNNTFANINSQYNPCIWIYTGGGGGCTIDNITIDSNRFTNCKDISSFSLSPAANTSITNNVFDSASLGGIICASAASHTGQTLTITGNTVGTIDHTHFYGTVTENNNNPPS
jgi:hypothetical protein